MAAFIVPSRLVRPGSNIVSARLSAHHLWLPVHRPVHAFEVGFYSNDPLPGLGNYLPALLALGALAAAGLYFAAAASLDRRDRGALLLALIAAMVVLQLGIETLRSFVSYSYPWHIARVAAIAILASATATLIAAYAARRFAPEWQRRAVIGTGAASLACLLLVPWYDIKAIGALSAGMIGLQVVALRGIRRRGPGARTAAAVPPLFFLLLVWQRTAFLDQAYYVVMAAVLVALVAEQLLVLRQSRRGHQAEEERAASLEERLRELTHASVGVAVLKDGAKTHRVPEDQILFIKAADDYSEVQLESGRTLLVTMTLARLHATLSERFVRIHKSYVVNAGHVASLSPRPGGGRILTLTGGSSLPVGRSYLDAVAPLQTG